MSGRRGSNVSAEPAEARSSLLVFISYRRDDASGYAGRLQDSLLTRFSPNQLFVDVDAIPVGVDFAEYIDAAVGRCDVLLALIGPRWLTATDAGGRRRLEDENDYVRLETQAALARGVVVVPVLVQGAEMPTADQLPEGLRPLARRNALEMSDGRWRYDAERLIGRLAEIERERYPITGEVVLPVPSTTPSLIQRVAHLSSRRALVGLGLTGALLAVILGGAIAIGLGGPAETPEAEGSGVGGASASVAVSTDPSASEIPPSALPATPLPSADATAMTAAERALLRRLPVFSKTDANGVPICGRHFAEGTEDPFDYEGLVASITCLPPAGTALDQALYYEFENDTLARGFYDAYDGEAPITYDCVNGPPSQGEYRQDDTTRGILACYVIGIGDEERVWYVWTHDATSTVVTIRGRENGPLYEYWTRWVSDYEGRLPG